MADGHDCHNNTLEAILEHYQCKVGVHTILCLREFPVGVADWRGSQQEIGDQALR